jgi:hypothetical protein
MEIGRASTVEPPFEVGYSVTRKVLRPQGLQEDLEPARLGPPGLMAAISKPRFRGGLHLHRIALGLMEASRMTSGGSRLRCGPP